jgi:hypothetical protein
MLCSMVKNEPAHDGGRGVGEEVRPAHVDRAGFDNELARLALTRPCRLTSPNRCRNRSLTRSLRPRRQLRPHRHPLLPQRITPTAPPSGMLVRRRSTPASPVTASRSIVTETGWPASKRPWGPAHELLPESWTDESAPTLGEQSYAGHQFASEEQREARSCLSYWVANLALKRNLESSDRRPSIVRCPSRAFLFAQQKRPSEGS